MPQAQLNSWWHKFPSAGIPNAVQCFKMLRRMSDHHTTFTFSQVKFYCIWLYLIHFIIKKRLENLLFINIIQSLHHLHKYTNTASCRLPARRILIIFRKISLPSVQLLRKPKLLLHWWQWQRNDQELAKSLLRTESFYFTGKQQEAPVETTQGA